MSFPLGSSTVLQSVSPLGFSCLRHGAYRLTAWGLSPTLEPRGCLSSVEFVSGDACFIDYLLCDLVFRYVRSMSGSWDLGLYGLNGLVCAGSPIPVSDLS